MTEERLISFIEAHVDTKDCSMPLDTLKALVYNAYLEGYQTSAYAQGYKQGYNTGFDEAKQLYNK